LRASCTSFALGIIAAHLISIRLPRKPGKSRSPHESDSFHARVGLSRGCGHNAVIRVYDSAGNVIETHKHAGEFKEWRAFPRITSRVPLKRSSMVSLSSDDCVGRERIRRNNSVKYYGKIPSISRYAASYLMIRVPLTPIYDRFTISALVAFLPVVTKYRRLFNQRRSERGQE
jgi:hypothetical protein